MSTAAPPDTNRVLTTDPATGAKLPKFVSYDGREGRWKGGWGGFYLLRFPRSMCAKRGETSRKQARFKSLDELLKSRDYREVVNFDMKRAHMNKSFRSTDAADRDYRSDRPGIAAKTDASGRLRHPRTDAEKEAARDEYKRLKKMGVPLEPDLRFRMDTCAWLVRRGFGTGWEFRATAHSYKDALRLWNGCVKARMQDVLGLAGLPGRRCHSQHLLNRMNAQDAAKKKKKIPAVAAKSPQQPAPQPPQPPSQIPEVEVMILSDTEEDQDEDVDSETKDVSCMLMGEMEDDDGVEEEEGEAEESEEEEDGEEEEEGCWDYEDDVEDEEEVRVSELDVANTLSALSRSGRSSKRPQFFSEEADSPQLKKGKVFVRIKLSGVCGSLVPEKRSDSVGVLHGGSLLDANWGKVSVA